MGDVTMELLVRLRYSWVDPVGSLVLRRHELPANFLVDLTQLRIQSEDIWIGLIE